MSLKHAVLAALLDGEYSGYQLAKAFDAGVANFWHALPQQLYAELTKLETEGLVAGPPPANRDQRVDPQVARVLEQFGGPIDLDEGAVRLPDRIAKRIAAVGGPENRSTEVTDSANGVSR